jgi:hypothetical protein
MARTRRFTVSLVVLVALAATTAVASASASGSVKEHSGPLSVTFVPSTHTPKVNAKWPLSVTASVNGKPAAHATAVYEFLFGGLIVSTQYPRFNKHFTFTGHFSDNLIFPPDSKAEPLTLRVVIKASGHTVNLNWSITAHS